MSEQVKRGASIKFAKPLVEKIEGPFDENDNLVEELEIEKTYVYKATKFKESTFTPIKHIWFAEQLDDGEITDLEYCKGENPYLDDKGIVCFKYKVKECEKVRIYAYVAKPIKSVSIESCIQQKVNKGGAFVFMLADEILPSGKLVRKVIVPPTKDIISSINGNIFERYGMNPPNPSSNITIGEHASGLNNSKYLSSSSIYPDGAPNFNGSPQYIDIKKAKAAGCTIHSTEEIIKDLRRLQSEAPSIEAKARLDKVINAVGNIEKEVLIEGNIPNEAIKSQTTIKITKGLRIVSIIGMVITAYELEQATEKSIKQESFKPIAAETIRQIGGWGGAIAGAKVGALAGVAVGIETGPGALITGAIGGIIFGTAGYFGADWIADFIDEN